MGIPFIKMHGIGNDFVVLDNRSGAMALSPALCRAMADRRRGIGCDQLVVLEPSDEADIAVRFYNADGSESGACGNATRCVAWLVMEETGKTVVQVQTQHTRLHTERVGDKRVKVNMGTPKFNWQEIPLKQQENTSCLPISEPPLTQGMAVNMGNPHIVFFVENAAAIPLAELGARIEHHPLFPERINVEVVQQVSEEHIILRVWERGTGETLACGTGACAAAVVARVQGKVKPEVRVSLPGGDMKIVWEGNSILDMQPVWMTGEVAKVFNGVWHDS